MFAIARLGDIGWDREDGEPALLLDRRRGTRQRVLGAPGDYDPRARSGESAGDRIADPRAAAGYDRDLAVELRPNPAPLLGAARNGRSRNGQAIDWKRRASPLMCFAVSMSRSVIFMPASCVQNENVRML